MVNSDTDYPVRAPAAQLAAKAALFEEQVRDFFARHIPELRDDPHFGDWVQDGDFPFALADIGLVDGSPGDERQ